MKIRQETGSVSLILPVGLCIGLIVAAVVGTPTVGTDERPDEPAAPRGVEATLELGSHLFQLGDGIDPTLPGLAAIAGSGQGPDWRDLFNADGTLRDDFDANGVQVPGGNGVPDAIDRFGGRAAVFIGDDVSAGERIDLTVFDGGPSRWKSGLVAAEQDLGNSYVYLTSDAAGRLVLYAGVERLTAAGDSWVDFELNQETFRLQEVGGSIVGQRMPGDVRIRLSFGQDGVLSGVEVSRWTLVETTSAEGEIASQYEFVSIETSDGEGCTEQGTLCAFSNVDSIEGGSWKSFDASGNEVDRLAPGTFTELGVNLGGLLDADPEYSGAQTQSAVDLALGELGASDPPSSPLGGTATALPPVTCPTNLNSCTANDVVTTLISATVMNGDDCADGQIDLQWTVEYATTANSRNDLAVYIATDGGTIQNPGTALTCAGAAALIGDGDPNVYPDADDDLFVDNDGGTAGGLDTCGDLTTAAGPVQWTTTATVDCFTADDLILPSCRVWEQNANHSGGCVDLSDAGTGSKCDCTGLNFGPVIDPCLVTDCDDGNACTVDSCVSGGPGTTATCVNDPVADSTPCEDGDVCTSETGTPQTPDHCLAGVCTGVPVSCPGDQCNDGECNTTTGACEDTPVADSTPCEDGDVCTSETGVEGGADHCEAGVCTGIPVDCSALDDQCNDGVCNPGTGACEAIPKADSTPCEDGDVCTSETGVEGTPDHCEAGVCTGGPVDCSALDDQCNDGVCNPGTGACEAIPKADSTPCEDGDVCTSETGVEGTPDHCEAGVCTGGPVDCSALDDQCNDGVCNTGTGACEAIPKAISTPCEDGNFCTSEAGVEGTPDHCDGAGSCVGVPVDCSTLDDQCNDGVCNTGTGACEAIPKAISTPCEDGNFCTSEAGVEGTPDHCDGAGSCVGVPVDCSTLDDQCNDGVCNTGTGACEAIPKAISTPCEDGNFCTSEAGVEGTPDHCDGAGSCVGVPVDCSTLDDQCNDGVCNTGTGACEAIPKAISTPCEDGNFCTSEAGVEGTPDHCDGAGSCVGVPVDCSTLDDQCNDGVCNTGTGACEAIPKAISTPCEDGNFCTSEAGVEGTPDHCDGAGSCVGVPVDCSTLDDQCNDGVCNTGTGACEAIPKAISTPCEDGNFCTSEAGVEGTPDHCDGAGSCVGVPVDCSTLDDQCNDGVCNTGTGACEAIPKAISTPCEDGNFCTSEAGVEGTPDHCDGAGSCVGVPVDCSTLDDQCNDGVCNTGTGACEAIPKAISTPCEDGNFCTSEAGVEGTPDHCDGAGSCVGVPVDCSTLDDQCNDGVCNTGTGACEAIPKAISTPCEDGNFCTSEAGVEGTPDHCDGAGSCVGVPVDCSTLDDQCNDGVCNTGTGACEAIPKAISTPCEDGNFCTSEAGVEGTPDHCDGAGSCVGVPVDCSTLDDQCNDGVCNTGTGACEAIPKAISTPCEDGNFCTSEAGVEGTPDHCDGAGSCVGVPVDCSTLDDQCNDGVCNTGTGACEAIPKAISTPCEDGNFCTSEAGVEGTPDHCDGAGSCVGVPVDCSTLDDQCNDGVCNTGTGACEAIPKAISTPCEDGNFCTSEAGVEGTPDHCDGAGSCVGVPVDCSTLDDQCNDGVCNTGTGACEAIPKAISTPCEDGNFCTSEAGVEGTPDHCDGAGSCVGVPVDCSTLDDQCNDGVCNTGTGACEAIPKADSTPCEDGLVCTSETGTPHTPDHCEAGVCTGVPVDCSDFDDQCTEGTCDPVTGDCFADPVDDGTICDDGDPCTSFGGIVPGDDECQGGICVFNPIPGCDCPDPVDPRTQGYWHRQCLGVPASEGGIDPGRGGRGPSAPNDPNFWDPDLGFLDTYNCADARLKDETSPSWIFGLDDVCEGLDADPANDPCERAQKQFTAVVLNTCSERIGDLCLADVAAAGCTSETVGDLLTELAGLINSGDPGMCQLAADCADLVNTGEAFGLAGGSSESGDSPESPADPGSGDSDIETTPDAEQAPRLLRSKPGGRLQSPDGATAPTGTNEQPESDRPVRQRSGAATLTGDNQVDRNLAIMGTAVSQEQRTAAQESLLVSLTAEEDLAMQLRIVQGMTRGGVDATLRPLLQEHLRRISDEAETLGNDNVALTAQRWLVRLELDE